jgi:hypothetical protein
MNSHRICRSLECCSYFLTPGSWLDTTYLVCCNAFLPDPRRSRSPPPKVSAKSDLFRFAEVDPASAGDEVGSLLPPALEDSGCANGLVLTCERLSRATRKRVVLLLIYPVMAMSACNRVGKSCISQIREHLHYQP